MAKAVVRWGERSMFIDFLALSDEVTYSLNLEI